MEVKSKINIGTEFIIKLPLNINYSEDEIDTSFINTDNIKAYNSKWDGNQNENLSITIIDVAGKVVYKNNLQTNNFINKLDLNLINGLYLITINNSNNESITKKLVIAD